MMTTHRITIRIGRGTLAFAGIDPQEQQVDYRPYPLRTGISMAANLREAFNGNALGPTLPAEAQVMVASPVMFVPIEEMAEESTAQQLATLYNHTFTGHEGQAIAQSVLPDLNAVAVFAVNKDLKMVIEDHFQQTRYLPVVQPVVSYLHRRDHQHPSTTHHPTSNALYAYLHDRQMDIFAYTRNRLRFYNSYDSGQGFHIAVHDATYFLLYVWKQLAFDTLSDELYLCGDISDDLRDALQQYLQHVHVVNPTAEFNRAPITQVQGLPFDLMTLFVKGR